MTDQELSLEEGTILPTADSPAQYHSQCRCWESWDVSERDKRRRGKKANEEIKPLESGHACCMFVQDQRLLIAAHPTRRWDEIQPNKHLKPGSVAKGGMEIISSERICGIV